MQLLHPDAGAAELLKGSGCLAEWRCCLFVAPEEWIHLHCRVHKRHFSTPSSALGHREVCQLH